MRRSIILFLALYSSLICDTTCAQGIHVSSLDTDDGLPSPEVYFAIQDFKGYLWFGTDRGLGKFDGDNFVVFNTDNSNLTCNTIFKCYEAPNKDLWFCGYNGRISIYNQSRETFEDFKFNDSLESWFKYWPSTIYFNSTSVLIMSTSDHYKYAKFDMNVGNLSLVYYNDVLDARYKIQDSRSNQYFFYSSKLSPSSNDCLYLTNCNNCLDQDTNSGKWHITNQIELNDTSFFAYDSVLYAVHNDKMFVVRKFNEDINHISTDKINKLFILTPKGCYIKKGTSYRHILSGKNITGMAVDHEGYLWFSDLTSGVLCVPSVEFGVENDTQLNNKIVTKIFSYDDVLILGLNSEELYWYDSTGEIHLLSKKTSKLNRPFRINNVSTSFGVTTVTNGLIIANSDTGFKVRKLHTESSSAMTVYLGNNQYLSVPYSTAYALHSVTSGWERVTTNRERVTSIAIYKDTGVYIGTMHGLWYAPIKEIRRPKKIPLSSRKSLRINDMIVKNDSQLIIATAFEGVWFKNGNGEIFVLNTKNGLSSNVINCMHLYNNKLWVGTNKGVTEILVEPSHGHPYVKRNINMDEGLISDYVYSIGVWRDEVWVGTDKGLTVIPLSDDFVKRKEPYLNLLNFYSRSLMNKEQKFVFSSKDNDFTLNYVGITSRKPTSNFYRYRVIINGEKKGYRFTDNNSVDFYNLESGNYIFEIACRNKDNVWSKSRLKSFVVAPGIHEMGWFKTLVLIIISCVVTGYVYWRLLETKRINVRETAIKDLKYRFKESELALLRNQMNPHFIFNALNSIESYILKNDISTGTEYIKSFSDLMRLSLEYSRSNQISFRNEISFLKTYLRIEQLRFPKRFRCQIIVDSSVSHKKLRIPPLLLQPIIENAIKHAFNDKTTDGIILVTFKLVDELLICHVYDNGVGIGNKPKMKASKRKSYGLKVVRERLKHLDDSGNVTVLEYINRGAMSQQKRGTKVTIRIPVYDLE